MKRAEQKCRGLPDQTNCCTLKSALMYVAMLQKIATSSGIKLFLLPTTNTSYAQGASNVSWRILGLCTDAILPCLAPPQASDIPKPCQEPTRKMYRSHTWPLWFAFLRFNADVYELRSAPQELPQRAEPHPFLAQQSLPHHIYF